MDVTKRLDGPPYSATESLIALSSVFATFTPQNLTTRHETGRMDDNDGQFVISNHLRSGRQRRNERMTTDRKRKSVLNALCGGIYMGILNATKKKEWND